MRTFTIDNAKITAKSVEISKCLINKEVGFHGYDLDDTITIGDTARLAANIRQAETIDAEKLAAISMALKQEYRIIRSDILPILEDLGWVEIYWDGRRIKRIDESVPPLQDILSNLGKMWYEKSPTDVDLATIKSLEILNKQPTTKEALLTDLDVSDEDFNKTLDYGIQAKYFGQIYSQKIKKELIWTPYYWAGKIDSVKKFLSRQSTKQYESIGLAVDNLINYPGRPLEYFTIDRNIVNAGINCGLFPSVGVTDRNNRSYEYIFAATPQFELDPKKDIFEKARLIVSCIRHGQHHAEVSKIKYPTLILNALRENRLGPHSYHKIQYALLIINGICNYEEIDKFYGKGYKINFIDTPENNVAMDIAEELLRGIEPVSGTIEESEIKELLTRGMFNYSAEQRQIKSREKIVAKDQFDRMIESMHGSRV